MDEKGEIDLEFLLDLPCPLPCELGVAPRPSIQALPHVLKVKEWKRLKGPQTTLKTLEEARASHSPVRLRGFLQSPPRYKESKK